MTGPQPSQPSLPFSVVCPFCERWRAVTTTGFLYDHEAKPGVPCDGSRRFVGTEQVDE